MSTSDGDNKDPWDFVVLKHQDDDAKESNNNNNNNNATLAFDDTRCMDGGSQKSTYNNNDQDNNSKGHEGDDMHVKEQYSSNDDNMDAENLFRQNESQNGSDSGNITAWQCDFDEQDGSSSSSSSIAESDSSFSLVSYKTSDESSSHSHKTCSGSGVVLTSVDLLSSKATTTTTITEILNLLYEWKLNTRQRMDQFQTILRQGQSSNYNRKKDDSLADDDDDEMMMMMVSEVVQRAEHLMRQHDTVCSQLHAAAMTMMKQMGDSSGDGGGVEEGVTTAIDSAVTLHGNVPLADGIMEGYEVVKLFSTKPKNLNNNVRVLVGLDYDDQNCQQTTCKDSWLVVMKKKKKKTQQHQESNVSLLLVSTTGDGCGNQQDSILPDDDVTNNSIIHHSLFSDPIDPVLILTDALAQFRLDTPSCHQATAIDETETMTANSRGGDEKNNTALLDIPSPLFHQITDSSSSQEEQQQSCHFNESNTEPSKQTLVSTNFDSGCHDDGVDNSRTWKEKSPASSIHKQPEWQDEDDDVFSIPSSSAAAAAGTYDRGCKSDYVVLSEMVSRFPFIPRSYYHHNLLVQLPAVALISHDSAMLAQSAGVITSSHDAHQQILPQLLPYRIVIAVPEPNDVCLTHLTSYEGASRTWRELVMRYAMNTAEFPTWSDDICYLIRQELARENITRFVVTLDAKGEPSGICCDVSRPYLATDKEVLDMTKIIFHQCRQFPNRFPVLPSPIHDVFLTFHIAHTKNNNNLGSKKWRELIKLYARQVDAFPTWCDIIGFKIIDQLVQENNMTRFVVNLNDDGEPSEMLLYVSHLYVATKKEILDATAMLFAEYRRLPNRTPAYSRKPDDVCILSSSDCHNNNNYYNGATKRWRELIMSLAARKDKYPTWSNNGISTYIRKLLAREYITRFVVTLDATGELSTSPLDATRLYLATDMEIAERTKMIFLESRRLPNRIPALPEPDDIYLTVVDIFHDGSANKRWRELIVVYAEKKEEFPTWLDDICFNIRKQLISENANIRFVVTLDADGKPSENACQARLYLATDNEVVERIKMEFLEYRKLPDRVPAVLKLNDICITSSDAPTTRRWRELILTYAEKREEFPTWSDDICWMTRDQLARRENITRFVVALDAKGYWSERLGAKSRLYLATDKEIVEMAKITFMEFRRWPNRIRVLPEPNDVCLSNCTRKGAARRWRELIMDFAEKQEQFPAWSDGILVRVREQLARENMSRFVVTLDHKGNFCKGFSEEHRLYLATDVEIAERSKLVFLECRQLPNRIPAMLEPNDVYLFIDSRRMENFPSRRWHQLVMRFAKKIEEFSAWTESICSSICEQLDREGFTRFVVTLGSNGKPIESPCVLGRRVYLATDWEVKEMTKLVFEQCRKLPDRTPVLLEAYDICLTDDKFMYASETGRRWREAIMSYAKELKVFPTWSDEIGLRIRDQLAREIIFRFVVALDANGNLCKPPSCHEKSRLYLATDEELVERTKTIFLECRQHLHHVATLAQTKRRLIQNASNETIANIKTSQRPVERQRCNATPVESARNTPDADMADAENMSESTEVTEEGDEENRELEKARREFKNYDELYKTMMLSAGSDDRHSVYSPEHIESVRKMRNIQKKLLAERERVAFGNLDVGFYDDDDDDEQHS